MYAQVDLNNTTAVRVTHLGRVAVDDGSIIERHLLVVAVDCHPQPYTVAVLIAQRHLVAEHLECGGDLQSGSVAKHRSIEKACAKNKIEKKLV